MIHLKFIFIKAVAEALEATAMSEVIHWACRNALEATAIFSDRMTVWSAGSARSHPVTCLALTVGVTEPGKILRESPRQFFLPARGHALKHVFWQVFPPLLPALTWRAGLGNFFLKNVTWIEWFNFFCFLLDQKAAKNQEIYGEPSHRPLPDTAIFSGHRAFAAAQQFEPF